MGPPAKLEIVNVAGERSLLTGCSARRPIVLRRSLQKSAPSFVPRGDPDFFVRIEETKSNGGLNSLLISEPRESRVPAISVGKYILHFSGDQDFPVARSGDHGKQRRVKARAGWLHDSPSVASMLCQSIKPSN
jgi:hypothetical protein